MNRHQTRAGLRAVLAALAIAALFVGACSNMLTELRPSEYNLRKVAEAKAVLTPEKPIFGYWDCALAVHEDFTLPIDIGGARISWASSDPSIVISASGGLAGVRRPPAGSPAVEVILTATITSGGATEIVTITVTVQPEPANDTAAVAEAASLLTDRRIGLASGDTLAAVSGNLSLPVSGLNGSEIRWGSSDEGIVTSSGRVTRPATADAPVTLTAVVVIGTVSRPVGFDLTVLRIPESDALAVAADERNLAIAFAEGDSSTSVRGNLTLPVAGSSGTTITWSSDKPALIAADGIVVLPTDADQKVVLTATIVRGGETITKTFEVTVKRAARDDAGAVSADTFALRPLFAAGESAGSVGGDITLPTRGSSGTTISWHSDDETVIAVDGKVARPSGADRTITLTATVTKNGSTETKTFRITVKKAELTAEEAVAADKAALVSTIGFASGDDTTNVTRDFTLPGSGANGTLITWDRPAEGAICSFPRTMPSPGEAVPVTVERQWNDVDFEFTGRIFRGAASVATRVSVKVRRSGTMGALKVTVSFQNPTEPVFSLAPQKLELNKKAAPPETMSVAAASGFASYTWWVDQVKLASITNTCSVDSSGLLVGFHNLRLDVTSGGKTYSAQTTFGVVEK